MITWTSPFMITVSLVLIGYVFGWSMLIGLLVIICACPCFYTISKLTEKYVKAQTLYKDTRLNLMNEIISGIKIIKMYAWEDSFIKKVLQARKHELKNIRTVMILNAFWRLTTTLFPFLVSLAIFGTYVYFGQGQLTAEKAFASITLFGILKFPVVNIPQFVTCLFYYDVSAKRISKFLHSKDLEWLKATEPLDLGTPNIAYSKPSVSIRNGNFAWTESDEKPILENINLEIPQGKLVAIIGQVGSGKSSLLSAVIGEMEKQSGEVEVNGRVGYVAQQSWIQNQSLRNNILFGRQYEHEKYETIIQACSLKRDIALLPASDLTEIGEKGINLSGGQKQRVSLARAVYDDADVYLMDDPLSAVDAHVGKHIFDSVIGPKGLLKSKVIRRLLEFNLFYC